MFKCKNCPREFETVRGKNIHETRSGHWQDPKPPTPPEVAEHINFADIATNGNWGQKMLKAQRKNPSDRVLAFAYQARTVDLLEAILQELQKPKTLR